MIDKEQNGEDIEERKKTITDRDLPLAFAQSRHLEAIEGINCITQTWRTKERVRFLLVLSRFVLNLVDMCDNLQFFLLTGLQMKTVSVALVLCLNVGVDPPDVVKTQPCARLECWIGKLDCNSPITSVTSFI